LAQGGLSGAALIARDVNAPTREIDWSRLAPLAWAARARARVHGPTRVGAAVLSRGGDTFVGCNVEHRFRSHDVHAEVNALTSMVAAGHEEAVAVLVAAERDRFTPCGSCLDWIFELGGPACLVAFQGVVDGPIDVLRADQLMPHYPS
jgi:cytidine deaminase